MIDVNDRVDDFATRQMWVDVETLEMQIKTVNMPDKLRLRKMNLLAELYSNLGEYEKSDNIALAVIKQGQIVAKKDYDMLDVVREAYCLRGKRHFDDYMIATEWNREKNARFWLPRRKILEGKLKIASKLEDFMNNPNKRLFSLSLPPGTGKSTLIKFLLAFIAGKYPQSANMYVSYSDGMIKMMYDSVVDMLTDGFEYDHTRIFGERATPSMSAQYGTISYRKRGDFPTIGMISLGGSVTGRTRANKFLITDDLVKNAEVARSPERLEKLWQDYTSTLTTRQIGDDVKQIMLGTIWSAYDPISRMMSEHENDPRYEFVCIPVWDEDEHSNFLYEHPDRYTDEKIRERQESLDPVDFSCLYLQNPVEKEGMPLKANELKYYNGVLPDGEPDDIFFVTDVAWGGGDSLSMPIIYVFGDEWYLHDVVFDNRDKESTRPRVVGKILKHACKSGRFEANNGGDEYADKTNEILRNDYGYICNITHQKAPTNMAKLVRIEQYIPEIKQVYYRGREYRDDEYNRFMKELCSISFRSKNLHDDAADSMAMAVDYKNTHIRHCKVSKYKRSGML